MFFTLGITFIFVINTFLAISRFFIEVYRAEQSLSADTQSERGQNLAQSDQTVDLQLRELQPKLYSQCAFACNTQHIVWKNIIHPLDTKSKKSTFPFLISPSPVTKVGPAA